MAATPTLDQLSINTIRFLSADAVQRANSGHPGLPMGAAPMAYVLWTRHLKHDPADPLWFDRDRFVLSAGHGSMLLYSLLHLTGYDVSTEELKNFRQLGSKTPGHPEVHHTPGVETTTGPLGQGFANGVGMAIAERHLAAVFNTAEHRLVDHFTYAIVSDGDLMEGISHEAASLAGHLRLGKLIYLYDDNHISIDGSTDLAFTEDVLTRFEAYGWHTQRVNDGNDLEAIDRAIEAAKAETERPSLIAVRTIIGYGAPNRQGSAKAHGEPLGEAELQAAKENLGWTYAPFKVPKEVRDHFKASTQRGREAHRAWEKLLKAYCKAEPALAQRFEDGLAYRLGDGWQKALPVFKPGDSTATRVASGKALGAIADYAPWLVGGSADLTPSNKTDVKGRSDFQASTPDGRYFRFGVREHGMASAMNGIALHGGLRPYGGTFLIFLDYLRPALRLSALMRMPVVYVFTHDSIGLGEDGPTHQPIGQLMSLRAVPGLTTIRPADPAETVEAWRLTMEITDRPVALALSRQDLPVLGGRGRGDAKGVRKGAYVLVEEQGNLDLILIGTGSEVQVCVEAGARLSKSGVGVRVVSMPSWDLFDAQPRSYRERVLPPSCRARVAVEAGWPHGWERYVGLDGGVVGMETYGASGRYEDLFEHFGFTAANVVKVARGVLRQAAR
ncbi:MAG TPA: transketolase [Rhodothermales bacterium]|nr:transketolase [Rhodothermales bacterium]